MKSAANAEKGMPTGPPILRHPQPDANRPGRWAFVVAKLHERDCVRLQPESARRESVALTTLRSRSIINCCSPAGMAGPFHLHRNPLPRRTAACPVGFPAFDLRARRLPMSLSRSKSSVSATNGIQERDDPVTSGSSAEPVGPLCSSCPVIPTQPLPTPSGSRRSPSQNPSPGGRMDRKRRPTRPRSA